MKKIAIIVRKLYAGGAERAAATLSRMLSKFYHVYIFAIETTNVIYDYAGELVNIGQHGEEYAGYYIAQYKKKYQIDCAISMETIVNFLNIVTKSEERVIVSERCALSRSYHLHYMLIENEKRFYPYADKIVAVADGTKAEISRYAGVPKEHITTIWNFIDREKVEADAEEPISDDVRTFIGTSKLILNVGRLDEQKNQKKLLVQFKKLVEDGEDVKLLMIGSGELEHLLVEQVHQLRLNDRVRIVRYGKNPFPYYKAASIFALTSNFEGLPNVVLEAMQLGLPVVSVDCVSGPRELLKESSDYSDRTCGVEVCCNGILVEQAASDESGKTAYFKDAVKLLLHDDVLREKLIENAKEFMKRYSNESILQKWIDVIEGEECGRSVVAKDSIPELKGVKKLIVYGAGKIGRQTMRQYVDQRDTFELLCFAVSDGQVHEEQVMGVPVYELKELQKHREDAVALIAVGYEYESEVEENLKKRGFRYVFANMVDPLIRAPP